MMIQMVKAALAEASPIQTQLGTEVKRSYLLGNGDMTALIMGNSREFSISITKNDVWDKRLKTEMDIPPISDAELRKIAMQTPHGERSLIVNFDDNARLTGGKDSYDVPYPCPVICTRATISANLQNASHKLDLETATVESSLPSGMVRFYIPYDHNVLMVEGLTEENVEAFLPVQHLDMDAPEIISRDGCQVLLQRMPGDLDVPAYAYAVACRRISANKLAFSVFVADAAEAAIQGALEVLSCCKDSDLYAAHKQAWEAFWSRSYVELDDKLLQAVWYRNTYLLGSCAKKGCVSPALFAGLNTDHPNWHGDYHMNYNYQSVFSGAYITNHCDVTEVYDDFMLAYLKRAKWVAKRIYGVEGAFYPVVIYHGEPEDPETCHSKNNRQYFNHIWGRTLGNTAMAVQDMLWHWYYDPSKELLQKIYPVLRESADFYCNLGDLRQAITVSPEHWGITPQLFLNHESTYDITFIKYMMKGCIKAAQTLGVDAEKQSIWAAYLENLPPYPTTADYETQLAAGAEFYEKDMHKCINYTKPIPYEGKIIVDIKNAPPSDLNLPAPILPVFPGGDIDLASSAEEQKLARDSFKGMYTVGFDDFIIAAAARIRMRTEDMHTFLHGRLQEQMMPNGFLASGKNLDHFWENYGFYTQMMGITVAISEQMLQSNKGFIRLFPALPEGGDGRFENLRAEGGVLISAVQKNGKLESATLKPQYDGKICLCVSPEAIPTILCDGQPVTCRQFTNDGGETVICFEAIAGKSYHV